MLKRLRQRGNTRSFYVRACKPEVVLWEQVAKVTKILQAVRILWLCRVNLTPLLTGAVAFLELGLRRCLSVIVPLTQAITI